MTRILDLGSRVELLSMDPLFHDISIALYVQQDPTGPGYHVHSYASLPGTAERLAAITAAMASVGGLVESHDTQRLHFACGDTHERATRRVFFDACKLAEQQATGNPAPRSALTTVDRKTGLIMTVRPLGDGQYRVSAAGQNMADAPRRVGVIVNGLLKLGDMLPVDDAAGARLSDCVSFACGHDHDALVSLLLQRAPNVRAIVREQASAATRGVLAAPSSRM